MTRWGAALLLAAACGSNGKSASFNGTVHGLSLTPTAALSSQATVQFASGTASVAALIFSDAGTLCTKLALNQEPKSSRALILFLADVDPASGQFKVPAGTGTYPIFVVGSGSPPAHFSFGSFGANDPLCNQIAADSANAVSGSVTLTGNSADTYSGTYEVSFDSGDRVTGSFDTGACRALATFLAADSHQCG